MKKVNATNTAVLKRGGFWHEVSNNKVLLLMVLPAILYFLIFHYLPMFGVILAFKKYDYALGILKSEWIGLKNFEFFFKSGQAYTVTRNTFLYNIVFILLGNFMQLAAAIFLTEIGSKKVRKTAQTCIFFPYFISWVVVGAFVYNLFSYDYGMVNSILKSLSLEPINVYTEPKYWPFILVILNVWKGLGYGSVVYMATITGIDTSIYEAAEIDGASIMKRIWHITIPSLRATMITLILLALGRVFRGNLTMFYSLVGNNGLLYNYTDVIDTFTFRTLLFSNDIGMSSAVGFYQSVLCFVFIMLANAIVKKVDDDSALF
ncbi:MAG: ABC transporter permease subunit [Oscillospiraceae bacterium]|nr:ABC transporter permease subunit [Oscillospiraceae bacterium]